MPIVALLAASCGAAGFAPYAEHEPVQVLRRGVIDCEPIVLAEVEGVRVEGHGATIHGPDYRGGWTNPGVQQGTLLRHNGHGHNPLVTIRDTQSVSLGHLTLYSPGKVGLAYVTGRFGGNNALTCDRVSFLRCSVGFWASRTGKDANSADCSFRSCLWTDCNVGFRLSGNQNVNYALTDLCRFDRCRVAISAIKGGNVLVSGASFNGCPKVLGVLSAAGNMSVFTFLNCRFDRSGSAGLPVLADLVTATDGRKPAGKCVVNFVACTVVAKPGDNTPSDQPKHALVRVGRLFTKAGGEVNAIGCSVPRNCTFEPEVVQ